MAVQPGWLSSASDRREVSLSRSSSSIMLNLAPMRFRPSSNLSIDALKMGYESMSSRPMACHWAPWPVKTKPLVGGRVDRGGFVGGEARAAVTAAPSLAEKKNKNDRKDRRWPRV